MIKRIFKKFNVFMITIFLTVSICILFGVNYSYADQINEDFSKSSITISYDANGADSGFAPNTQHAPCNSCINLSENIGRLSKNGILFTGWNTRPDKTGIHYSAGQSVTLNKDTKLYAQWGYHKSLTVDGYKYLPIFKDNEVPQGVAFFKNYDSNEPEQITKMSEIIEKGIEYYECASDVKLITLRTCTATFNTVYGDDKSVGNKTVLKSFRDQYLKDGDNVEGFVDDEHASSEPTIYGVGLISIIKSYGNHFAKTEEGRTVFKFSSCFALGEHICHIWMFDTSGSYPWWARNHRYDDSVNVCISRLLN